MSPAPAFGPYRPPRPLAVWAFERYFRSLFRTAFQTTRLALEGDPAAWREPLPTLFVANHTNWWDGFYCWLLGREMGLQPHVLMEAANLARYRAFTWIGTLPMHRDNARAAYDDLHRAAECLVPGNSLWIFPQGQRRPATERPTRLERGAAQIALACTRPIRIAAAATRYAFLGEQNPEAFALVGPPWVLEPGAYGDRRALMARLEADLHAVVDALDARLRTEDLAGFRVIVEGKLSINKRMDRARHAVGLLDGEFEARNG